MCGQHSTHRLVLEHIHSTQKQRCCDRCVSQLAPHLLDPPTSTATSFFGSRPLHASKTTVEKAADVNERWSGAADETPEDSISASRLSLSKLTTFALSFPKRISFGGSKESGRADSSHSQDIEKILISSSPSTSSKTGASLSPYSLGQTPSARSSPLVHMAGYSNHMVQTRSGLLSLVSQWSPPTTIGLPDKCASEVVDQDGFDYEAAARGGYTSGPHIASSSISTEICSDGVGFEIREVAEGGNAVAGANEAEGPHVVLQRDQSAPYVDRGGSLVSVVADDDLSGGNGAGDNLEGRRAEGVHYDQPHPLVTDASNAGRSPLDSSPKPCPPPPRLSGPVGQSSRISTAHGDFAEPINLTTPERTTRSKHIYSQTAGGGKPTSSDSSSPENRLSAPPTITSPAHRSPQLQHQFPLQQQNGVVGSDQGLNSTGVSSGPGSIARVNSLKISSLVPDAERGRRTVGSARVSRVGGLVNSFENQCVDVSASSQSSSYPARRSSGNINMKSYNTEAQQQTQVSSTANAGTSLLKTKSQSQSSTATSLTNTAPASVDKHVSGIVAVGSERRPISSPLSGTVSSSLNFQRLKRQGSNSILGSKVDAENNLAQISLSKSTASPVPTPPPPKRPNSANPGKADSTKSVTFSQPSPPPPPPPRRKDTRPASELPVAPPSASTSPPCNSEAPSDASIRSSTTRTTEQFTSNPSRLGSSKAAQSPPQPQGTVDWSRVDPSPSARALKLVNFSSINLRRTSDSEESPAHQPQVGTVSGQRRVSMSSLQPRHGSQSSGTKSAPPINIMNMIASAMSERRKHVAPLSAPGCAGGRDEDEGSSCSGFSDSD